MLNQSEKIHTFWFCMLLQFSNALVNLENINFVNKIRVDKEVSYSIMNHMYM